MAWTLARPKKSQRTIPPHLHILLGWISKEISYDNLDWGIIGTLEELERVNPLQVISRNLL
jgi:hypothetical protein